MPPLRLIALFAPADLTHLQRLKVYAAPLLRGGQLRLWDRSQVPVGADRDVAVRQAWSTVDGVLLGLSPDFFDDDTCQAELAVALQQQKERGVRLVPVLLRRHLCVDDRLRRLVSVPDQPVASFADPDDAWERVLAELRSWPALADGLPTHDVAPAAPPAPPRPDPLPSLVREADAAMGGRAGRATQVPDARADRTPERAAGAGAPTTTAGRAQPRAAGLGQWGRRGLAGLALGGGALIVYVALADRHVPSLHIDAALPRGPVTHFVESSVDAAVRSCQARAAPTGADHICLRLTLHQNIIEQVQVAHATAPLRTCITGLLQGQTVPMMEFADGDVQRRIQLD